MGQTLTQYQYLDRDMILKGVAEWIVKESPFLTGARGLPFKPVQGNALKYNVEVSLPTVSWLAVGDQITENVGAYEQRSTSNFTMIGDADTDKSQIALNATQNPEAIDIAMKAKAMAHEFEKTFILGQTSTTGNTKQFKGLLRMLAELESTTTTDLDGVNNSQVIAVNAASGALTMAYMDQLIDQIMPGKPDLLLMSKKARRKLTALQRAAGSGVQMTQPGEFGMIMPTYDGIPIYVSDWMPDNILDGASSVLTIANYVQATARASGVDNSIVIALKISDNDVTGLNAGEMSHEVIDPVENYNVRRNRFVWYCGAACFRKYSLAALININPDS